MDRLTRLFEEIESPLGPLEIPLRLNLGESRLPGTEIKPLGIRGVRVDEVPVKFDYPAHQIDRVLATLDLERVDPHVDQGGNIVEEKEGVILERYAVRPPVPISAPEAPRLKTR